MITEAQSLRVSRRFFDIFKEAIEREEEDGLIISGYIDTFNNCRETGFRTILYKAEYYDYVDHLKTIQNSVYKDIAIWAYENRNSDNLVVIVSTNRGNINNMYSEESYKGERKFFEAGEYVEAADYAIQRVKEIFALALVEEERKTKKS